MCLLVLECIGNIAFFGLQPWYRRVGDSGKVIFHGPGERIPGSIPGDCHFCTFRRGYSSFGIQLRFGTLNTCVEFTALRLLGWDSNAVRLGGKSDVITNFTIKGIGSKNRLESIRRD